VTDFDALVREQGPLVFRTAWRVLGCAADAEDVAQEVFLEAHEADGREPVRNWGAFLRRLTVYRALDARRRRRADEPLDEGQTAASGGGPEEESAGRELAERLRAAVIDLPRREAAVFCLRCFEELSYQEIAAALGITTSAAAAALHKARRKLETALCETRTEPRA
jgi:RNA polymerase sigma-70 factor (ECF subfamily)